MCGILLSWGWVLSSLISFPSAQAFAADKQIDVSHVVINDYDVYFINTHKGNGVAFTANIQGGSWMDDPIVHAGRAHLWEHVIHGGSKKYPGHGTLWDINSSTGADYNAYTSDSRIYYHYYAHPDALPEMASILGAMTSAPEWNKETFTKELKIVMNEALDYQGRDDQALSSSILINLLPAGHPLAMYDVGTQAQLSAMTQLDLKKLYYSNYRPGSMQILVAGNFDALADGTVPLKEDALKALIQANFIPPNPALDPEIQGELPAPMKSKIFPPIYDASKIGEMKFIEIGTESDPPMRKMTLHFQGPSDVNYGVQETMLDYLNLVNSGSFRDKLNELGWINSVGFYPGGVNNLNLISASFSLTEEGAAHRMEIVDMLMGTLHHLQQTGIEPKILNYLKERNLRSYAVQMRDPEAAAERLARWFDSGAPVEQAFRFQDTYGNITSEQIQALVAKTFDPQKMLGGYLGPEIKSEQKAPIFNRPLIKINRPEILAGWKESFEKGSPKHQPLNIELKTVPLQFSDAPLQGAAQKPRMITNDEAVIVGLREDHSSSIGGISMTLQLPVAGVTSVAAGSLFARAFSDHYKNELSYLDSFGVPMSIGYRSGRISAESGGNSKAAAGALKWALSEFIQFVPTSQELKRALARLEASVAREQQEFSATVAGGAAMSLMGQHLYQSQEILAEAKTLNVRSTMRKMWIAGNRADIGIALSGDFNEETAKSFTQDVIQLFPNRRTPAQRKTAADSDLNMKQDAVFWMSIEGNKAESAFGIARAIQGTVRPSIKERAAMWLLSTELGNEVFKLNRVAKGLGYVHQAFVVPSPKYNWLELVGMTDKAGREGEIAEGWDTLLEKIRGATLSSDGFEATKKGLLRQEMLIPRSEVSSAGYLLNGITQIKRNPNLREDMGNAIRELKADEIYQIGREQILDRPTMTVVVSKEKPKGCEIPLTSAAGMKKALEGK